MKNLSLIRNTLEKVFQYSLLILFAGGVSEVMALSYKPISFDDFLKKSAQVLVGHVEKIDFQWEDTAHGQTIYSYITFVVETPLRGAVRSGEKVRIRQFGGEDGAKNKGMRIAGAPRLDFGERLVLFLEERQNQDIPYTQGEGGVLRVLNEGGQDVVRTYSGRPILGLTPDGFKIGRNADDGKEKRVARVVTEKGEVLVDYKPSPGDAPIGLKAFVEALKSQLQAKGL